MDEIIDAVGFVAFGRIRPAIRLLPLQSRMALLNSIDINDAMDIAKAVAKLDAKWRNKNSRDAWPDGHNWMTPGRTYERTDVRHMFAKLNPVRHKLVIELDGCQGWTPTEDFATTKFDFSLSVVLF